MSGARRAVAVGVAAAAFLFVALAAAGEPVRLATEGSGGWFVRSPSADDASDSDADDQRQPPEEDRLAAGAASAVVQLAVFVAGGVLIALLVRALLRMGVSSRRRDRPPLAYPLAAPTPPELAEAVEEGMRRLASGPVDDAIVACWVRLEEAAAGAGVERLPSETATELTVRLLERFDVPARALSRLLGLYRTARYSHHHLGEDDRAAAVAALQAIGVAIEGERAVR